VPLLSRFLSGCVAQRERRLAQIGFWKGRAHFSRYCNRLLSDIPVGTIIFGIRHTAQVRVKFMRYRKESMVVKIENGLVGGLSGLVVVEMFCLVMMVGEVSD
jgi:hypothetical protein